MTLHSLVETALRMATGAAVNGSQPRSTAGPNEAWLPMSSLTTESTAAAAAVAIMETTAVARENGTETTTETPFEPYPLRPETYMVPIVFTLIFVVGVLGNGLLVLVFVRHRGMRNVPNT